MCKKAGFTLQLFFEKMSIVFVTDHNTFHFSKSNAIRSFVA
jgi:hypothetical protein